MRQDPLDSLNTLNESTKLMVLLNPTLNESTKHYEYKSIMLTELYIPIQNWK